MTLSRALSSSLTRREDSAAATRHSNVADKGDLVNAVDLLKDRSPNSAGDLRVPGVIELRLCDRAGAQHPLQDFKASRHGALRAG